MRTLILLTLIFLSECAYLVKKSPIVLPNKSVRYYLTSDLNDKYIPKINDAIKAFEGNTCLRFDKVEIGQSFAPDYKMFPKQTKAGGTCSQEANLVACKNRCSGDSNCFAFDFGNWNENCCRWISVPIVTSVCGGLNHYFYCSGDNYTWLRAATTLNVCQRACNQLNQDGCCEWQVDWNKCVFYTSTHTSKADHQRHASVCKSAGQHTLLASELTSSSGTTYMKFQSSLNDNAQYSQSCYSWAASEECDKNPNFMGPNCAKSCEFVNQKVEANPVLVISSELGDKCHAGFVLMNLAGQDDKVGWCGLHVIHEFFHSFGFAHEQDHPDFLKYFEPKRRMLATSYHTGVDDNSVVLYPGYKRKSDGTVNEDHFTPSEVDYYALNHVYCGETWCHKGGYLLGGNNLFYKYFSEESSSEKQMIDWAINLCKTTNRCSGFTRLERTFWFKHDRERVYNAGAFNGGHYWESWMKCEPFSGRRKLHVEGTYASVPLRSFKDALEQISSGVDVIPPSDTPAWTPGATQANTISVFRPAEENIPNSVADAILKKDEELDDKWLEERTTAQEVESN